MNNPAQLTKRELRERLGAASDAEVARFYRISPAAVSQWGEDEPIPELRVLQASQRRPDIFGPTGEPGLAQQVAA